MSKHDQGIGTQCDGVVQSPTGQASEALFQRAQRLIPGGVNSPVRSFRSVEGTPVYIKRADGCFLFDVDGRRYIDYIGAWGPAILGHAHPAVVAALQHVVGNGTAFGTCCEQEVELAERLVARYPSIEKVRMTNSGTEAVMSAVRLARAATQRELIVKFAGCYHGHMNGMLARAGSGVATLGLPDSPGVLAADVANTLSIEFGDVAALQDAFSNHAGRIAAVIVEPVAANMGVILPPTGFLENLREVTTGAGTLLIFDEVMTGCRIGPAGAQGRFGVMPDLTTLGKVIGGGIPVGAYGGSAELMDMIAPAGPVYQAGTFSGNPLAMTGGIATLDLLDAAAYEALENRGARLAAGLQSALRDTGVTGCVQRVGSMLTIFFGRKHVRNYAEAQMADMQMFARFFQGMLKRGIHLPPSGFEAWFVSLAHGDAVIDETILAARDVLANISHQRSERLILRDEVY